MLRWHFHSKLFAVFCLEKLNTTSSLTIQRQTADFKARSWKNQTLVREASLDAIKGHGWQCCYSSSTNPMELQRRWNEEPTTCKATLFLLCGIGMVDAATAEPLGMDEYNNVTEQETNKKEITKLAKMMRKITLLLTVQGLGPVVAESTVVAESAEVNEQCPSVNVDAVERQEHFGMWLVIFILLVLWFLFAYMAWFAWRKMQENPNTYAQKLDKGRVGYPLLLDSGCRRGQLHCPTSCQDRWTSQSIHDD